jgi:hypothetical protein
MSAVVANAAIRCASSDPVTILSSVSADPAGYYETIWGGKPGVAPNKKTAEAAAVSSADSAFNGQRTVELSELVTTTGLPALIMRAAVWVLLSPLERAAIPNAVTAIPATSATTTIFRWVARSAEWIEWFISASRRLKAPLLPVGIPAVCFEPVSSIAQNGFVGLRDPVLHAPRQAATGLPAVRLRLMLDPRRGPIAPGRETK